MKRINSSCRPRHDHKHTEVQEINTGGFSALCSFKLFKQTKTNAISHVRLDLSIKTDSKGKNYLLKPACNKEGIEAFYVVKPKKLGQLCPPDPKTPINEQHI